MVGTRCVAFVDSVLAVEVMQTVGDDWGEAWLTQGVGAVGGVEVFVELVGERAVVAGFGEVVPGWWIGAEEGVAACSSVSGSPSTSDLELRFGGDS